MSGIVAHDKILCKVFKTPRDIRTVEKFKEIYKTSDPGKLNAVFNKLKLWGSPRSTISIGFLEFKRAEVKITPEPWRVAWTCWVVSTYIQPYIGIRLNFVSDFSKSRDCDVRITFDPDLGSYSLIGMDCLIGAGVHGESTNIGWVDAPAGFRFTYKNVEYTIPSDAPHLTGGGGVSGGTIMHEFGHILGMIHEHQNPFGIPFKWDRNQVFDIFSGPPNEWDQDTIIENFFLDYNEIGVYNGSSFDPNSIMKYAFGEGNRLLDRNSYSSLDQYIRAVDFLERTNTVLSQTDKYWLQKNYPGGTAPPIDKPEDSIEYDQPVPFIKKLEFFFRYLDATTKNKILIILISALILFFLHDFVLFFYRKSKTHRQNATEPPP